MNPRILTCLLFLSSFFLIGCGGSAAGRPVDAGPAPEPKPTFDITLYGLTELDITYCTPDTFPQQLDIYFPEEGGPWPVLLYVHGGSWREGNKDEGAGWQDLNDAGFLVASINYRLAAKGKFPIMIEDVKCAVRYLRAHAADYNIDPGRIAALGASAGGQLVALLGTAGPEAGWDEGEYAGQSSRVQAVVSLSGLSDLTVKLPSGINSAVYYAFGALAGSGKPEMAAASPVIYIDDTDPPYLIVHGNRDGIVPVEQSEILYDRLRQGDVDVTLVIVEGGDHGLQGEDPYPSPDEVYDIIVDFLIDNLQ